MELLCDWKYLQEESWTHVAIQDMGGGDSMLWPERSCIDTSTVETAASGEATHLDWDQRTKKVDSYNKQMAWNLSPKSQEAWTVYW